MTERVCDCDKWKSSIEQIMGFFSLGFVHGMFYTAEGWDYCPWCGKELIISNTIPKENENEIYSIRTL